MDLKKIDSVTVKETQTAKLDNATPEAAQDATASSEETKTKSKDNKRTTVKSLQQLQDVLGLPRLPSSSDTSYLPDPVIHDYRRDGALIVCIEFDDRAKLMRSGFSRWMSPTTTAKIGMSISVLDTRKLNLHQLRYALCTRDFCITLPAPHRMDRIDGEYLFRKRTLISSSEIVPTIEQFLDRTRNIIFVGDKIERDLVRLKERGFDLKTSVIGCLSISQLCSYVSRRGSLYQWDLKTTLRRIQFCSSSAPGTTYIGGSDADFNLRCVILFAAECYYRDFDGQDVEANVKLDLLSTLSCTLEIELKMTEEEKERLQEVRRNW